MMEQPSGRANPSVARVLAFGVSALFVGIGIGRFAYSPLIPLLIRDGWYTESQAQLLGAWGLFGYLAGGFLSQSLARRYSPGELAGMMGLAVLLSFVFCSFPISFVHAAIWRTISGVAGAVLMISGMSASNERLVAMGRPGWSGLVFMGVGGGAALGSMMMVFLPDASVAVDTRGLAVICALSLMVNLWAGRAMRARPTTARKEGRRDWGRPAMHWAAVMVIAAYALDGLGMTAYSLYVVDYVTRETGLSDRSGAIIWAAFGVGAMLATIVPLHLVRGGLFVLLLLKGLAIAVASFSSSPVVFWLATFIVGFGTPGTGMLVSAFIRHTIDQQLYIRYWAMATIAYAMSQAVGGFSASRLSQFWEGYQLVFLVGASCLGIGALTVALAAYQRSRAQGVT